MLGVAPIVLGIASISTPAFAQTTPEDATQGEAPAQGTGPVEGQTTTADAPGATGDDAAETGDIVVTGSRIRQPNLESASPITVVTPLEIKQTGTTRVEDLINSLPQVFAAQGSNISNGSTGTATLSLRGLGAERNLVLVNGRRLVPGDPGSAAADINAIPGALVERIDVLTGGASSVYGADAVSGVVNFIMDTDFEGFKLDGQYSFYNHENSTNSDVTRALNARGFGYPTGNVTDGGTIDTTLAFGAGFDDGRGHVTGYVGYRKIEAVSQARRDYSACVLGGQSQAAVDSPTATLGRFNCGGSATSANGTFILFDSDITTGTSTFYQVGDGRTFVPGFTPFNFAPTNYYQRPDERYTAGFFANYEISDAIKPYAEFMFMDDRTVAQIAPSGNFGNTFSINCDNPLLSAQQFAIICDTENLLTLTPDADGVLQPPPLNAPASVVATSGLAPFNFIDPLTGATYNRGFAQILRRNVEGGPRQDDRQHTSYRAVAGVKGDLNPAFSYDAYFQYGRTIFSETYLNDFSITRLTRALDVVAGPGGVPTCRSVLDGTDPNCVPYDIFAPGAVTPQAVAYLATPGFQRGINGETVANASVTGQLGEYGVRFPWSERGVGIAVGTEYRRETLDFNSDTAFQTGDLAGQGAATLPVSGQFEVIEGFGEIEIPIVSDSFFHELTLIGGYRYSSYNNTARTYDTHTYKAQAEFAPIRDIRFRGGYNRAVRAPTVQDFFAPNVVALDGSTDPCAGAPITAAQVGCLAQGLTVGQVVQPNPAAQYNGLLGGNVNLVPEKADTYTVGVVLQPSFIRSLSISVDYFDISIDKAIGTIGADTILGNCVTEVTTFCDLIQRDSLGSIWRTPAGFVTDVTQNIGGFSTKGIDINGSYNMSIGSIGTLGLSFVGTYLDELVTDTGTPSGSYDCKGLYGNVCGTPNPEWRHQARVSYTSPGGIGASLRWRYFSSATLDAVEDNANLNDPSVAGPAPGGVVRPGLARLPSQSYFDLALTARIGDHYNFRIGANNILDNDPPLTGSQACPAGVCNGNTFAQVYDSLGRYIYAGVTLDF